MENGMLARTYGRIFKYTRMTEYVKIPSIDETEG